MIVRTRVCARARARAFLPYLLATDLPSRVAHGTLAISVYWHTGSVTIAKLTPGVTPRHFVFNMK